MVDAEKAAVRPRVISPDGDGVTLLEDAVRSRLDAEEWGLVELTSLAGAGKSTALAHLAHVFGDHPMLLLSDRPDAEETLRLRNRSIFRLAICAAPGRDCKSLDRNVQRWRLAPWTNDDCIEYLLSAHPQQCASVMRRVQADRLLERLSGLPELTRVVLDRFADDETIVDVRGALRAELVRQLTPRGVHQAAAGWSFKWLTDSLPADQWKQMFGEWEQIDPAARPLLRHTQVQHLLAADFLIETLRCGQNYKVLEQQLPLELLQEAATKIGEHPTIIRHLEQIVCGRKRARHSVAASLLHLAQVDWRPRDGRAPLLSLAYLQGVPWQGIRLSRLDAKQADFCGANLCEAQLQYVEAWSAQFVGAHLHGAQLHELHARKANFNDADLSHVRAPYAELLGADCVHATSAGALLKGADFTGADLTGCNLQRADLRESFFTGARLTDADFTGADLSWATLAGLCLRLATFTGAQLAHVMAADCDLEGMRLPGANFERATLSDCLFTGSQMPDACFRHANLQGSKLADVDWERADLREADLRGCNFHFGSSRSGLVDSPIASEGSRTGFYTDEFLEQGFKAPEEIRKANLCGADLRGARIDDVDFYLVDLRGAKYTAEQEALFRSCRAILEARV